MNTRDFDKDAADWDKNPARIKLASDIARALVSRIKLRHDMDVVDFGCGTGLLTLFLAPFVNAVTAVDFSQGMLDVLNKKIAAQKVHNVKTLYWNIAKSKDFPGKYHLVTSSMVLHHIEDLSGMIDNFYDHLVCDGFVVIADLDPDDGEFHEDKQGVFHNGFSRELIKVELKRAGFRDVVSVPAATINKPVNGIIKKFTVFLAVGKK